MTIIFAKEYLVAGQFIPGYQISCHNPNCHCSQFMKSVKHLPDDVIANKFRERGWEVNATGKDFCQDCIIRKRGMKKGTILGPRKKNRLTPIREVIYLNADNIRKTIITSGLPEPEVIELENTKRKFKITFHTSPEIRIGRIIHAEGEILEACNASLVDSWIKPEFIHTTVKNFLTLEFVMHWYLILEENRVLMAAQ